MTDSAEALLPADILARADFRHNEYAWRVADLPDVVAAARDKNLRNLGGQLQIRTGDAIMVKGSLGSKMKTIVNALQRRLPGKTARPSRVIGHIECFTG